MLHFLRGTWMPKPNPSHTFSGFRHGPQRPYSTMPPYPLLVGRYYTKKKKLKQFFSLHLKLHSVKKTSGLFPSFKLLPSRVHSWLLSLEAGLILLDFESLESVVSGFGLVWFGCLFLIILVTGCLCMHIMDKPLVFVRRLVIDCHWLCFHYSDLGSAQYVEIERPLTSKQVWCIILTDWFC